MLEKKKLEFSFEVKEDRHKYPEIEEVREAIEKSELKIQLYKRAGMMEEAKELKS